MQYATYTTVHESPGLQCSYLCHETQCILRNRLQDELLENFYPWLGGYEYLEVRGFECQDSKGHIYINSSQHNFCLVSYSLSRDKLTSL